MAEETVPAPTRTDDQLVPVKARFALRITPKDHAHPFVGVVTGTNIDYAELIWEEFVQEIKSFFSDAASLKVPSKKPKPHVIPYFRFTKLIICYLGGRHNIHKRPQSPLHITTDNYTLGNLKFIPKGGLDENDGHILGISVVFQAMLLYVFKDRYKFAFVLSRKLRDIITGRKKGSSKNTYSKLSGRGLSSRSVRVIAMNLLNLRKEISLRTVPSMEWRILLHSSKRAVDIKDHPFSFNSKIVLFLFNSNDCISSVKEGSSQNERNFAVFFHFENNKISREGLRVSRDSFAYKKYGIRFMLEPRGKYHWLRHSDFLGYLVETMIKDFDNIAFGQIMTMSILSILSYKAKHRLEIHFHVEKKHGFLRGVGQKELGKESANESDSKFIPCYDSSFVEFVQPCFCFSNSEEFMNVFIRIVFSSTIKLVSFDKGQVVTFNGKFICSFKNSDHGTRSQSDNTVGSPHEFIIHWIVISKNIKKVTKVIDVENWRIDNSRVLSLISGWKCGAQDNCATYLVTKCEEEKCGAQLNYLKMAARKPRQPNAITNDESVKKKTVSPADKTKKPAPAKQMKLVKEKSTKPTPSKKSSKGKVMKVRKGKRSDHLVDEADKEPLPDPEPLLDDDEYNLQRGIQMSLESFQPPIDEVAFCKPASGVTRSLPIVEGKGKGIATNEQAALSLLDLQKPKKKIRDTPSPIDAKTGAVTENSNSEGDTEILNAGSDPGNTLESRPPPDEDRVGSNPGQRHVALARPNLEPIHEDFISTVYPTVHESLKHTTEEHVFFENPPSSSRTLSSMKNLDDDFTFGDHFIDDKSLKDEPGKDNVDTEVESIVTIPIHQAYLFVPPLSVPIIDLSPPKPVSPHVQGSIFIATATTTTLPPLPLQQQSTVVLELAIRVSALEKICANFKKKHKLQDKTTQALSSRVFMLEKHDLYLKIDNYVNETVKEVVQNALQALVRERFREFLEFEMKEILRDRMFESGSYRSQPKHAALYNALKTFDTREAPSSSSKQKNAPQSEQPVNDVLIPDDVHISDSKDIGAAYLPKIKTRPDWLKPIGKSKLSKADLEDPSFKIKKTKKRTKSDQNRTKTGNVETPGKFKLSLKKGELERIKECHLLLIDQIDLVNLEGDKERRNALSISKLKAAYYPDFRLEELVLSLWIESKREYDISAAYGISHWWFKRTEFYITRHNAPSDSRAVRSYMKILSVVSLKTFSQYVRMTKVIKGEFEKLKDLKVEDVLLTCDTSLKVFNNEFNQMSKINDDLFTYEVEVANIPYDSNKDDDLEKRMPHEADDDTRYNPSDIGGRWINIQRKHYRFTGLEEMMKLSSQMKNFLMMKMMLLKSLGPTLIYLILRCLCARPLMNLTIFCKSIQTYLQRILWGLKPMNITKTTRSMNGTRMYHGYMISHGLIMEYGRNRNQSNILASLLNIKLSVWNGQPVAGKRMVIVMEEICPELTILETRSITKTLHAHELPVCNIRKFKMIKYSFRLDKEYVAVKEDEYDDLARTSDDACRAYQEIFRMMDEGWMTSIWRIRSIPYGVLIVWTLSVFTFYALYKHYCHFCQYGVFMHMIRRIQQTGPYLDMAYSSLWICRIDLLYSLFSLV
uniref:Uncharacterized protein n=1 Tax=Tanacetum cinerariifolium TaxID=118510 RepID=A0A6L2KIJ7_TANCI|nr:hypothetical protein [Tanacetum cinerariifolium]